MTLKELIMKVSFDELLPYLKEYEKKHLDDIYSFREAYDILRNMEPNKDYKGQVTVITATRKDGTLIMQINFLDDDVWENELAKEFVFPNGMPLCMEEFAMRCLWEITYWGFSPCEVDATEVQMFGLKELKNKYEVALDKLEESIWKHQAPRRLRSKGQDDELYTSIDFPLNKNDGRKNRSKRKREYRQDRRQEYLEKMAARENLVRMLTADGSSFKRADVDFFTQYCLRHTLRLHVCNKRHRLTTCLHFGINDKIPAGGPVEIQRRDSIHTLFGTLSVRHCGFR